MHPQPTHRDASHASKNELLLTFAATSVLLVALFGAAFLWGLWGSV